MPEFFLELFSEEIPARMQKGAAEKLQQALKHLLVGLSASDVRAFYGSRRIALSAQFQGQETTAKVEERGPRENATDQAVNGFLAKHKASRDELAIEGGYYWLRREQPSIPLSFLLQTSIPTELGRWFSWPKSMRWGQGGEFTWVRPLRRIVCLLDGEAVPITLGPITASNETEGHRIHGPGPVAVFSAAIWEQKLREHNVIADQDERRQKISEGIGEKAAALGLTVAPDDALLDEVTGLVEWPVPLIGQIDEEFMDLPPEVRELSMKVNQKYFALRDGNGNPAPYFVFIANLAAEDEGAAIIAGNERVLRARLSDARHFWDLDLKHPLFLSLPKLGGITFHAKLGTQLERAERIATLAQKIAELLGADEKEVLFAAIAGRLCKADLVTGMVGEFPELQGIMGGYYATRTHGAEIGDAIRTHYQPKGPSDAVPTGTLAISVALADKLDTLTKFFEINEKPTGSGDPYALRRAALGVIRIILENNIRLSLKPLLNDDPKLFDFIIERLRVKLRGEGKRYDVLDAVLAASLDDDLVRVMMRVNAVTKFLESQDGKSLLTAYRRAANILRIEDAKDGPHHAEILKDELKCLEAENLADVIGVLRTRGVFDGGYERDFSQALAWFSELRIFVDRFFENVTVNSPEPQLRRSRLALLASLRDTMHLIADFSKIEG